MKTSTKRNGLRTFVMGSLAALTVAGCHDLLPLENQGSRPPAMDLQNRIEAYRAHNESESSFLRFGSPDEYMQDEYPYAPTWGRTRIHWDPRMPVVTDVLELPETGSPLLTVISYKSVPGSYDGMLFYDSGDDSVNVPELRMMAKGDTLVLNEGGYIRDIRPSPDMIITVFGQGAGDTFR